MATFTTWAAFHAALLDKLASRDFSKASAELPGGGKASWSSADEFLRVLEYARTQAAFEAGTLTSFRAYAKDGGRG